MVAPALISRVLIARVPIARIPIARIPIARIPIARIPIVAAVIGKILGGLARNAGPARGLADGPFRHRNGLRKFTGAKVAAAVGLLPAPAPAGQGEPGRAAKAGRRSAGTP
jgi:hypothetical protein